MFKRLTAPKLLFFTLATIVTTMLLTGLVVFYEVPGFIGFFFGAFAGESCITLLALYVRYMEEKS